MPGPPKGLSLYGNLLDPNDPESSATISSAPVIYNQTETSAAAVQKPIDPALRFQPIRRPQVKQPTKPKGAFPKAIPKPAAASIATESTTTVVTAVPASSAPAAPQKSTLADWAATEDDDWQYGTGEKRQRGGRRKKKKRHDNRAETDWNEIYDPTRPTNVEEYLRSDEKISEVREWRALLYRHRKRPDESDISDEDEHPKHLQSNQFAPPASYAFAPPPPSSPPAQPPAPLPDDKSGDDAFARRLAMTQNQAAPSTSHPPPPPPPEPSSSSATISRAPIRYTQPSHQDEDDEDEADYDDRPAGLGSSSDPHEEERSSRPGQQGFAKRLMGKYGWTQGTGLGADETGIVNPLRVQVDKRRKKADADGGGWAEPGGKGKIIGSKRKEEASKFGPMSEVIVLRNMLDEMPDLEYEIANGLGQEIGEECGEKYGRVERLYIDQVNRRVFIKFTNQVSALRAVNELDGRKFNGNTISPSFYDVDSFEKGKYV